MFILCPIPFTLCCQRLFILHEVRVPSRSFADGLRKVSEVKECKSWENVIVEACFLCALRKINLHICARGKKKKETLREQSVGVCDRAPTHPAFERPLNLIFTLNLNRKQRRAP